jgi:two-component system response regulator ChvI
LRVIAESQRVLTVGTTPETERHGDLTLHPSTSRALWQQRDVGLTITKYKIVVLLVSHKGQAQSYRAIYDAAHYIGFVAGSGERGRMSGQP